MSVRGSYFSVSWGNSSATRFWVKSNVLLHEQQFPVGNKARPNFFYRHRQKIETFGAKNISDAKTKLFLTTLAIPKTNFCRRFDRFVSIDAEKVFLRQRVFVVDWADATERERESTSTSTSTSGCRCRWRRRRRCCRKTTCGAFAPTWKRKHFYQWLSKLLRQPPITSCTMVVNWDAFFQCHFFNTAVGRLSTACYRRSKF